MAFYHGLAPVPGAYIHLDAGNPSSYPGSGTTWNDISGNGRHFTVAAASYTNAYAGNSQVKYFNFRATYSAFASNGVGYLPSDANGITVCVWTRIKEDTTEWRTLMRGSSFDHQVICEAGGVRLGSYDNQNATGFSDSGFNVQNLPGYPLSSAPGTATLLQKNESWVMMVFQWQAISPYYSFQVNNNPTLLGAITNVNSRFKNSFGQLGSAWSGSATGASQYWGDIATFQMYERLLTQAEINQNYEAYAPRFYGGPDTTAGVNKKYVNVFPGLIPEAPNDARGATMYNDGVNAQWVYPGNSRNLFPYPYAGASLDGTFVLSYSYDAAGGATMTYATGVDNPVNAPGVMRYYTGNTGYKYFALRAIIPQAEATATAKNVNVSYWARLVGGSPIPSSIGNSQLFRDEGIVDRAFNGDYNPAFTSEWKRYSAYAAVTNILNFFPIHSGSLTGGYTIEFCGFQAELGTAPTQFASVTGIGTSFRYRTMLTHGYLAGGYKGSNPWRAVNRTWHATDTTMYCGEQLAYAANYIEGTFSDLNGYVHNGADAYATASQITQSYSLSNGTARTRGSSTYSPPGSGFGFATALGTSGVGGWNMSVARGPYLGCAVDQMGQVGYIAGGGTTNTDKFHFPSETMFTTTAGPNTGFTSGCHGQSRGYFSFAGTKQYIDFSTNSYVGFTTSASPDAWSKFMSTKLGHHYAGNGANVTIGLTKFSDATGTDINAGLSKLRAAGEENLQMGQNWGYMLGNYDNQQNNQTVKYNYLNDVLTQMGVACQPKGHFGQSSACCSSAAASIVAAYGSVGM